MSSPQEGTSTANAGTLSTITIGHGNFIAGVTVLLAIMIASMVLWAMFQPAPVIASVYTHPKLLNAPIVAKSAIDAALEVESTAKMSSKSFVYVEFCLSAPVYNGVLSNSVKLPDSSIVYLGGKELALVQGCYNMSVPVQAPNSLKPGEYVFQSKLSGSLNALRPFQSSVYEAVIELK